MNEKNGKDEITIDPEFASLIPPLDEDEYQKLEESILEENGLISPLVVWNGVLIDGHHRYEILRKYPERKLYYEIYEADFPDRYAAKEWICENQLARRNLSPEQKKCLIGNKYDADKQTRGGNHGNQYTKVAKCQDDTLADASDDTAEKIAKKYGVSRSTVLRDSAYADAIKLAEETVPGTRQEIWDGKIKPTDSEMQALLRMKDPKDRKELIEKFHQPKPPRRVRRSKASASKSQYNTNDEIDVPLTDVSIEEIEEISARMEHCDDPQTDADGVIGELEDALETMIFRWNKCIESNPKAVTEKSYKGKRHKLVQEGIEFLQSFDNDKPRQEKEE